MSRPVFAPNPHETVSPTGGFDAFRSALVGMVEEMPREVIIEQLDKIDASAIVLEVQGKRVARPDGEEHISPVERKLSETVAYCAAHAIINSPVEAVVLLEGLKLGVAHDGDVFVGEERPYSYYNRPQ